ncbi:MAG: cyclodeaminase/cyclohydrolase family protein [Planctomycetota bacterium]|jgi:formiminotetrahydrofolate cyclodeaminase
MIHQPYEQFIASLAAKTPTPGGGACAAMAAAMGTALYVMVVRFSRGKKANVEREEELAEVETLLEGHLRRIMPMADRDCAAYDLVSAAYGLPKQTEEEQAIRKKAIEEAMVGAMVVPEETMCMIRDVFDAVDRIVTCVSKNIVSDLGSGSELLRAGAESAYLNVRINAAFLDDRELAETALSRTLSVRDEILRHHDSIRGVVDGLL